MFDQESSPPDLFAEDLDDNGMVISFPKLVYVCSYISCMYIDTNIEGNTSTSTNMDDQTTQSSASTGQTVQSSASTGQTVQSSASTGQTVQSSASTGQTVQSSASTGQTVQSSASTQRETGHSSGITGQTESSASTGRRCGTGAPGPSRLQRRTRRRGNLYSIIMINLIPCLQLLQCNCRAK